MSRRERMPRSMLLELARLFYLEAEAASGAEADRLYAIAGKLHERAEACRGANTG